MSEAYYYLNNERQAVGPMALDGIRRLADAGIVESEVMVSPADEEDWKPLHEWSPGAADSLGPPRVPPPPRPLPQASPTASANASVISLPALPGWLAPVSMVAGILAILTTFLPALAFLIAVPALVGGITILSRPDSSGRGFALTAVLTGAIGALPALLFLLGMFLGMLEPGDSGDPSRGEVAGMERTLGRGIAISREASKRHPNDFARQSRFIASELQKVDTRGCPPEFRVAYQRNVDAWEIAIPYLEANNPETWLLETFFGVLANDSSRMGLSNHQARLAAQNIDATYRELREIAVAYGAHIPTP